jgi:hypothetical protein
MTTLPSSGWREADLEDLQLRPNVTQQTQVVAPSDDDTGLG